MSAPQAKHHFQWDKEWAVCDTKYAIGINNVDRNEEMIQKILNWKDPRGRGFKIVLESFNKTYPIK